MLRRETPRKLAQFALSPFLWIGTITAVFQSSGIFSLFQIDNRRCWKWRSSSCKPYMKSSGGRLSSPAALLVFSLAIASMISSGLGGLVSACARDWLRMLREAGFAVGRFNKFSKCFAHCLVFSFASAISFPFSSLTVSMLGHLVPVSFLNALYTFLDLTCSPAVTI